MPQSGRSYSAGRVLPREVTEIKSAAHKRLAAARRPGAGIGLAWERLAATGRPVRTRLRDGFWLAVAVTLLSGCGGTSRHAAGGNIRPPDRLPCAPTSVKNAQPAAAKGVPDSDCDGITDFNEQFLAEDFAPIVLYHGPSIPHIVHADAESHFPTNVDSFLAKTTLSFYDDGCTPDLYKQAASALIQGDLVDQSYTGGCGSSDTVKSNGTRSGQKQRTFYLADVADQYKGGSLDSRDWTTYAHVYPNYLGGITIQYWRLYAFHDTAAYDHGGDWQAVYVVLAPSQPSCPAIQPTHTPPGCVAAVGLLDGDSIDWATPPWSGKVHWMSESTDTYAFRFHPPPHIYSGAHPFVVVEPGGHVGHFDWEGVDFSNLRKGDAEWFTWDQTWTGGEVEWACATGDCPGVVERQPGTGMNPGGKLLNVGEKSLPMNGQMFIQYSGLWGSPGTFFSSSGAWGPAFSQPLRYDGLISAWCTGMRADLLQRECYPAAVSR